MSRLKKHETQTSRFNQFNSTAGASLRNSSRFKIFLFFHFFDTVESSNILSWMNGLVLNIVKAIQKHKLNYFSYLHIYAILWLFGFCDWRVFFCGRNGSSNKSNVHNISWSTVSAFSMKYLKFEFEFDKWWANISPCQHVQFGLSIYRLSYWAACYLYNNVFNLCKVSK